MIYNVFGSLAMFASRLDGNQRNEQRKGKVGGSSLKRLRRQERGCSVKRRGISGCICSGDNAWRMEDARTSGAGVAAVQAGMQQQRQLML